MIRFVNSLRATKGLPPVYVKNPIEIRNKPVKITRNLIRQVCIEVLEQYPQSLSAPQYSMGELTLDLINKEVAQRLDDLRTGKRILKR